MASALVERGRILPVLDGLDEVPEDRQAGILRALNTAAVGVDGFILTSRRQAYLRALSESGDVLTAAAVIASLALTPADARRYLQIQLAPHGRLLDPSRHAAWTDVLARLDDKRAPDLATVVGNPLGLWLIRTVYIVGRRDPIPLIDPDHPDRAGRPLHDHLLDQLIPAVVRAEAVRGPGASDTAVEACCRYLTTIATQLRDGESRDWLWWQLAPNFFRRLSARLAAGLAVGVVACLPGVLLMLTLLPTFSDQFWTIMLLPVVVLCVVAGVALFRPRRRPRRVYTRVRGRVLALTGRVLGACVLAIASFLALAKVMSAVDPSLGYIRYWLLWAAFIVPGVVFCAVIAPFFSDENAMLRSTSPTASYRSDVLRVCLMMSIVALAVSGSTLIITAVLTGNPVGNPNVMMFALMIGLLVGAIFALAVGQAQTAFLLATAVSAVRGQLPFRLMRFLDHAHRLGLLRVVGAAYQFRHAELQDHLAPPAGRT